MKWLRDKHNIHVGVDVDKNSDFLYCLQEIKPCKFIDVVYFIETYESALEEGIKAALTYLKSKPHE